MNTKLSENVTFYDEKLSHPWFSPSTPTLTNKIHEKKFYALSKMHYHTKKKLRWIYASIEDAKTRYRHGWMANKRENCHKINSPHTLRSPPTSNINARKKIVFFYIFLRMAEQQRKPGAVFAKKAINKALP